VIAVARILVLLIMVVALTLPLTTSSGGSDDGPETHTVLAALASARVSAGPEASPLTRAPWGPELYRATVDAVVLVYVKDRGFGSGVVVSANCDVVTNWHVVQDARYVAIVFRPPASRPLDMLTAGDVGLARVLRTSPLQDLALIQLVSCPANVRYLQLEDPDQVHVGQDVFAIGHPEGLLWTYTEGVISQIRRLRWGAEGREYLGTVIQTQTPVSFGSSGGPLINRFGKVVGLLSNTLKDRPGFSFAISVHDLTAFLGR
jgi:S1-C subfamily serine protease